MRFLRVVAVLGALVGTFSLSSATADSSSNQLFSSDGVLESTLHESSSIQDRNAWPEANAWLHAQLSETEKEFLSSQMSLSATGAAVAQNNLKNNMHVTKTETTPREQPYCSVHPNACLNGGTCINGGTPTSYTCQCASAFIGTSCQYAIFPNSKRKSGSQSSSVPRGQSVTRPNQHHIPKPHHKTAPHTQN